jgi:hypothetical protein
MKNLMAVYGAAIVFLVVVIGYLWREVRVDHELIAELQAQGIPQRSTSGEPTPVPAMQAADAAPAPASKASNVPGPPPPAPPQAAVVRIAGAEVSLRDAALADADQTATSRVLAWRNSLAIAGQTLTTPQLQALDAATRAELRREAEDSLERPRNTVAPTDAEGNFRLQEENLNRENDANMRILDAVTTQLSAEQIRALRAQFEKGHTLRRVALKAARDMAAREH